MEEKRVTNIPIILQNTSRRSKQCQARAKVDNDISTTARLVGHQGEGVEGNWHGDDIIFPNLDMCLIMLAGWFNESPLKKIGTPGAIF
jgi:hypothetical protein